jgi:diphosphoinositol-polyphosphate diphosphatase
MTSTGTMGIVNPSKLESSHDIPTGTNDINSGSVGTPVEMGMSGRIKKAPVCSDKSLKETAMQPAALSQMCFTFEVPVQLTTISEAVPVSSASSTCTRESSGALSDVEIAAITTVSHALGSGGNNIERLATPLKLDRGISERLNAKISLRKTSRQGRSSQRWLTDSDSNETIRLVTGSVPILRGGKILFVSASRKPEWILPKGGWELDESLEESAIRESFEEAGVLGVLGPKLTEVQYETRKGKKRRIEHEETERKKKTCFQASDQVKEEPKSENKPSLISVEEPKSNDYAFTAPAALSDEAMTRIRREAQAIAPKACDETASIASTLSTATHSQVRMTLFPLYVSKVLDSWPESGRFRKAVDIDEAIAMTESRPELKAALMNVKERGLHLMAAPLEASTCTPAVV